MKRLQVVVRQWFPYGGANRRFWPEVATKDIYWVERYLRVPDGEGDGMNFGLRLHTGGY